MVLEWHAVPSAWHPSLLAAQLRVARTALARLRSEGDVFVIGHSMGGLIAGHLGVPYRFKRSQLQIYASKDVKSKVHRIKERVHQQLIASRSTARFERDFLNSSYYLSDYYLFKLLRGLKHAVSGYGKILLCSLKLYLPRLLPLPLPFAFSI